MFHTQTNTMGTRFFPLAISTFLLFNSLHAQVPLGAPIPWTTVEAEHMETNGTTLGPKYEPFLIETESSGQQCVRLISSDEFVQFKAPVAANSLVVRLSLPDGEHGNGTTTTLRVYQNERLVIETEISSKYSHLYGLYPFSNDSAKGRHRNYYDEFRSTGLTIQKGDQIRITADVGGIHQPSAIVFDLVDLETAEGPLAPPEGAHDITGLEFHQKGDSDYTSALRKAIDAAQSKGGVVYIPVGEFLITGDIVLPAGVRVQGAGMWYSTLVGNSDLYQQADRRVRLIGTGSNIHLSDFAITGKLNYRSDQEANDGIVGSFGENSTIENIWVEHTKVGVWVENSKGLKVEGMRFRNTLADGLNFCVGMRECVVENSTARGTGDDCFAMWPAVFIPQQYAPGLNTVRNCTAELPFLANGVAIYGGESNRIENCHFKGITAGSAILLSTTFPTASETVDNNFTGTTIVQNCKVETSGGWDHEWDWRAAVQVCLDRRSISGIEMKDIQIENSLSDGVSFITNPKYQTGGEIDHTLLERLNVGVSGLAVDGSDGLLIRPEVKGAITIQDSKISTLNNSSRQLILDLATVD